MRNLKILYKFHCDHEELLESDLIICGKKKESKDICAQLVNMFCLSKNVLFSVPFVGNVSKLFDFNSYVFQEFFQDSPPKSVAMWYRDLYDILEVCFSNGEIVQLALVPTGILINKSIMLGVLVSQVVWSPDEEYCLVVSDSQELFLFNADYNKIANIELHNSLVGEMEMVNVGWGSKETQFHGSEGKEAALKGTKPIDNPVLEDVSVILSLTWRGDSSLFAVGYRCRDTMTRKIKIFNNEGVLQCTNEEALSGIEEPLFWKPQGNLITFSQHLPNKDVVAFMEKNGLKHGDFSVPNNLKVEYLCWNETSTILCTKCKNTKTYEEEILLWTTSNYHWYLKQRFSLNSTIKNLWWDKIRPNRLFIFGNDGLYVMEWDFTVTSSYYSSVEDQSYVAVIDGENILLTSFKEAVIPPPMYSHKLVLPKAVNRIMFPPSDEKTQLLTAILSDGSIAVFSDTKSDPVIYSDYCFRLSSLTKSLAHWEWPAVNELVFCYMLEDGYTQIEHLFFDGTKWDSKNHEIVGYKSITCNRSFDKLIIQVSDGSLFFYDTKVDEVLSYVSLPEPSGDIKVHTSGIYSLSEYSRFSVDESQINLPSVSGNVTSFLLKDPYVLLTTSSHKLVILQYNNMKCVEISNRKLERGSRLITTSGNSVILQTPRGNLETIQPRALTILTIGNMLNSKLYKEALSLMRKQRIDLNLIVDHNQTCFLEDAQEFIEQIDPQWITLLITELNSDDVTKTSYDLYYKIEAKTSNRLNGSKVKTVCESLLAVMSRDETRKKTFMLPILSALVKIGEMGKAIKLANNDQSLQHLTFIVDVNKLYLEALGTYNLQAALKIAEKSQKDPKEYVPYLNSLREMEPNYMKYTIDKSLNRYSSALGHLSRCPSVNIEECIDFIREHALYSAALKLFKHDKERLNIINCLYGEHLYQNRCYEESGIMYLRGGDHENAIKSFIRAGCWRDCMMIAMKENYSVEKCEEVAQNVSLMLSSSHKFQEAALVYLEWLPNIENAVNLYILGKLWKEAIYIAHKHKKEELLGIIKESLLEAADGLIEFVSGNKEKMEKYVARLQVVRIEKQNRPSFAYVDDFSDTASETSSTSSVRTKSSQSRSSKNTKKMNRKMWSLKEGSQREEEALVATLSQLIQSAEKSVGDVHYTCSVLLYFEEDSIASKLQNEMDCWLKIIGDSKKIIWPRDPDLNETDILDAKYKFPPDVTVTKGWEFEVLKNI